MKIGILTFHKSVNYGSVMQAWALQELIRSFGHSVEIIDYEPASYKLAYGIYLPGNSLKNIKKNISRIPIAGYKKSQAKFFKDFRDRQLNLSKEEYGIFSGPKELEGRYDLIICGSDQIWNVHAKDSDDFFFLPDVNIRKIAYAISINNTDFTEERCDERMKKAIRDFEFLSFREEAGAERVRDFIGRDREVYTVLDPTLLHDKTDYDKITGSRIIKGDYVFLYKVWNGKDSYKMAQTLGERLGLPVYTLLLVNDARALCRIEKQGVKVLRKETRPEDYLSLIKNASYVMTDSFHGTAFSIIFERPFICVREKRNNGKEKNDERIIGLLKTLGLENRYVALSAMGEFDSNAVIDYEIITSRRRSVARDCAEMLKNAIETGM
ncbi:MAG: polysaccharide pyruvyl transferase family protein [Lachnospiraceae bacterium]|nr:polysaccharide pyruvyl transferase family protein [Lachnospiraceae bacterium]